MFSGLLLITAVPEFSQTKGSEVFMLIPAQRLASVSLCAAGLCLAIACVSTSSAVPLDEHTMGTLWGGQTPVDKCLDVKKCQCKTPECSYDDMEEVCTQTDATDSNSCKRPKPPNDPPRSCTCAYPGSPNYCGYIKTYYASDNGDCLTPGGNTLCNAPNLIASTGCTGAGQIPTSCTADLCNP